jgi:hypothetical protein
MGPEGAPMPPECLTVRQPARRRRTSSRLDVRLAKRPSSGRGAAEYKCALEGGDNFNEIAPLPCGRGLFATILRSKSSGEQGDGGTAKIWLPGPLTRSLRSRPLHTGERRKETLSRDDRCATERLLADEAGAARKDAHVRPPHAHIAPLANAVRTSPLIGAGAAVIDRPAAGAHRDRLAILPHARRRH